MVVCLFLLRASFVSVLFSSLFVFVLTLLCQLIYSFGLFGFVGLVGCFLFNLIVPAIQLFVQLVLLVVCFYVLFLCLLVYLASVCFSVVLFVCLCCVLLCYVLCLLILPCL